LEESEISSFLLFPYTNFVDKINSLNIEKEINKLHSRILKDIKDNRDKKKTLLKIRENSIKEIESLLKETKLEIEDIDKKEYKKLFLEFDNSHECSLLTNYKKHINFCLSEANKIALFKSKLINLIREAHNNFDQFKQETINEIKKEFFPFKLEEEMEGFETSS
jgi:hypothetical protein